MTKLSNNSAGTGKIREQTISPTRSAAQKEIPRPPAPDRKDPDNLRRREEWFQRRASGEKK